MDVLIGWGLAVSVISIESLHIRVISSFVTPHALPPPPTPPTPFVRSF
jgi:hypothetical protein